MFPARKPKKINFASIQNESFLLYSVNQKTQTSKYTHSIYHKYARKFQSEFGSAMFMALLHPLHSSHMLVEISRLAHTLKYSQQEWYMSHGLGCSLMQQEDCIPTIPCQRQLNETEKGLTTSFTALPTQSSRLIVMTRQNFASRQ